MDDSVPAGGVCWAHAKGPHRDVPSGEFLLDPLDLPQVVMPLAPRGRANAVPEEHGGCTRQVERAEDAYATLLPDRLVIERGEGVSVRQDRGVQIRDCRRVASEEFMGSIHAAQRPRAAAKRRAVQDRDESFGSGKHYLWNGEERARHFCVATSCQNTRRGFIHKNTSLSRWRLAYLVPSRSAERSSADLGT